MTLRNSSESFGSQNAPFITGASCPATVQGNVIATYGVKPYLRHAYEIMFDASGNDNGLCESNERCTYMPNQGAYQGHGNLIGPCQFNSGTISGVTMFAFEHNGE
jgi:hypothetical protein